MNGSINVTSGFAFGINYDFEDPEFLKIADYVDSFFVGVLHFILKCICNNALPLWTLVMQLTLEITNYNN